MAPEGRQEGLSLGVHGVKGGCEARWRISAKAKSANNKTNRPHKKKERRLTDEATEVGCGSSRETGGIINGSPRGQGRLQSEMEDFSKSQKCQ